MLRMAHLNRWGHLEFHSTFSSGFCYGMYINMYVHHGVHTFGGINICVHSSDVYVHVYTSMYVCWLIKHVHTMFKPVHECLLHISYLHTCVARYVQLQCTDGYILHFMKCTYIIELCMYTNISLWFQLFVLPGWMACRQGLAAAKCHSYASSKHTSFISISL